MSLKRGPGIERRPFWQNVYNPHSEGVVFFCTTGIYTRDRGLWHSDLLHCAANHRNLLLASSAKLDEMRDQYDYRSPFPEWCFAELRTLFLQNINNITSNYHLRIRIPMRQAQRQVFYTQLLHLISIITSIISVITSVISICTFKEVKS